jgi:hypothetical protein
VYKSTTKCNETLGKWCKNKHGASKIIDTFETYQCVEQPVSGFQGKIGGHPGEGAGRGEGAAMQAVAGEVGEKQPALQSLVVALGYADVVRRVAGESWLAACRATGERRLEEKGHAGEKHQPGEKWRSWRRFVVGRGGGGWPGLKW